MAENASKVPVKSETSPSSVPEIWWPFESLRREVDRLFNDFGGGFWPSPIRGSFGLAPFRRSEVGFVAMPEFSFRRVFKLSGITHWPESRRANARESRRQGVGYRE